MFIIVHSGVYSLVSYFGFYLISVHCYYTFLFQNHKNFCCSNIKDYVSEDIARIMPSPM